MTQSVPICSRVGIGRAKHGKAWAKAVKNVSMNREIMVRFTYHQNPRIFEDKRNQMHLGNFARKEIITLTANFTNYGLIKLVNRRCLTESHRHVVADEYSKGRSRALPWRHIYHRASATTVHAADRFSACRILLPAAAFSLRQRYPYDVAALRSADSPLPPNRADPGDDKTLLCRMIANPPAAAMSLSAAKRSNCVPRAFAL